MSSTSDQTQYLVSINFNNADANGFISVTANQTDTFQDTDAITMYEALVAALPAAFNATVGATITKLEQDVTQWSLDTSVSPPVFS